MSSLYESFTLDVRDGVANLRLNCPHKANSLGVSFWSDFRRVLAELSDSGKVRVLILSSEGKVFCSGLDLQMFANAREFHAVTEIDREALQISLRRIQDAINIIEQVRFPVIAAIQGPCIGAGFDLVTACDLCFATSAAYFRIEETNIGMMADLGVLQRLQSLIPSGVARYLAFSGQTLDAAESQRLGLLAKVFPNEQELLENTLAIARKIAERPPVVMSAIKQTLLYSRDHSVRDSLEHLVLLQSSTLSGKDIQSAIQGRTSGGAATFHDLQPVDLPFGIRF